MKRRNRGGRFSWSDLPQVLLSEIAKRLATRPDFYRFRAVCKDWKDSAPPSLLQTKHLLHSLFPYKIINSSDRISQQLASQKLCWFNGFCGYRGEQLVLVPVSVCLIRPISEPMTTRPWLACFEELNPGKLILRKPMSRATFKKLPESFPGEFDLSKFTLCELYKGHYIRFVDVNKNNQRDLSLTRQLELEIEKVVLLSNPTRNSNHSIEDFVAIALWNTCKVAAIKLSDGQENNVAVYNIEAPGIYIDYTPAYFYDVVNFKGQVYTVDYKGRVYTIDYHNLTMSFVTDVDVKCSEGEKKLFESCGELYMVNKCYVRNNGGLYLKLHKLDANSKNWDLIEKFGDDKILFITCETCFFASIRDFSNWTGNCIVSSSNTLSFQGYNRDYEAVNLSIRVFSHQEYDNNVKGWFDNGINNYASLDYSSVFWPPPPWLSSKLQGT